MLYDECQDCCISFDSYIKPQHSNTKSGGFLVVYLLIPTSNHNSHGFSPSTVPLYIFWFLHQTTTICCIIVYIFLLYIFWFLHQTTTAFLHSSIILGCISFDSYIKPQQCIHSLWKFGVVYLLIPTSNHNLSLRTLNISELYIFWFLHQTTTRWYHDQNRTGCISFDSYIKPQPILATVSPIVVVYLLIPTSNHNLPLGSVNLMAVVYLLIPTSNHNQFKPTSHPILLYIFWFLHQTTTSVLRIVFLMSCISFDSYIKPQLHLSVHDIDGVVYLLIPTSNHNRLLGLIALQMVVYLLIPTSNHNCQISLLEVVSLYIFWFLHQTTTYHILNI